MRPIDKAEGPPECLAAFKADAANFPTEEDFDRIGARLWSRFRETRALRAALIGEQRSLCCYCQQRIELESPGARPENHVEHLLPRAHFPGLMFDHGNLAASCQEGEPETPRIPAHCGSTKASWPGRGDLHLFIAPTDPDCSRHFAYTHDGRVLATATERRQAAGETIQRLRLDIPLLNRHRAAAIEPFVDAVLRDNDSLEEVLKAVSTPASDGRLPPFAEAIASVLSTL